MSGFDKVQIACPSCQQRYWVEASRIPAAGGRITCRICGERVDVSARTTSRSSPVAGAVSHGAADVSCPKCGHRFSPHRQEAAAPTGSQDWTDRKTILIVEDTDFFLDLAHETLGKKFRTVGVRNVAEALQVLRDQKVDLLMLDLALGNNDDGLSLLRSLPSKPCPVLIYTSRQDADLFGEGWEDLQRAGADDLLLKSMNVQEEMLSKVNRLLSLAPTGT